MSKLDRSETELEELVIHPAFYAGWPNAVTAADILGDVLARH
jgi:4-carboxymuconolactone decarboxylase